MEITQEPPVIAYNIFYKCHYKDYENNPEYQQFRQTKEFQAFTIEDKYFLEKKVYQDDLLSIFNVDKEEDFRDEVVNPVIHQLFLQLQKHEGMKLLMKRLGGEDLEMGLMMMFSMDFLYLAHPCFCEYFEKGRINKDKFDSLSLKIHQEIV